MIPSRTFVFTILPRSRCPPSPPAMSSDYATPPPQAGATSEEATPFMQRTFPVGSLFGIPVKLHALFPAYVAVTTVLAFVTALSFERGVLTFLVSGPVLFGTVLVHELGHCFATWREGGEVREILLWPLGGLAYVGHDGDALADLKVAVAGPLTHVPMSLAWLILLLLAAGSASLALTGDLFADLCREAIVVNVSLLVFNLLVPAFPLDGGRIFVASLLIAGVPVHAAAVAAVATSAALACAIAITGFVYGNFMAIFVGGWVASQAYELHRVVQDGRIDLHPAFAKYAGNGGASPRGPMGFGGASADAGAGGIAGALGGGGRV